MATKNLLCQSVGDNVQSLVAEENRLRPFSAPPVVKSTVHPVQDL